MPKHVINTRNKPTTVTFGWQPWVLPLLITVLLLPVQHIDGMKDWMQDCGSCHCNWISGKKSANCKSKELSAIPDNLSNELQVIDLSNNDIFELHREEFAEANLQNLHKIFMQNCSIQEVSRDTLKGLAILIELDMSNNYIRKLHVGTFDGLVKLRSLVMNHNEIETLDDYLFANLQSLSRIEFNNNRLKRIGMNTFGHLNTLTAIYLESNMLQSLRKEIFLHAPKLLHLSLAHNPWNCTCDLVEFRNFVLENRLYTPPTDCSEPANLRGKLWNELSADSFACRPQIIGPERTYVEAKGENITIPCYVTGVPQPNVTWTYNKRSLASNDQRFRVRNSLREHFNNVSKVFISQLAIFGVRASDKGTYLCVATNRGGKATAEIQLSLSREYFGAFDDFDYDGMGGPFPSTHSNILWTVFLIGMSVLVVLIVVVLVICWYLRRMKSCQKDASIHNDKIFISPKSGDGSILEGSVIMEMQKSLLRDVNPVMKPPRRSEVPSEDATDERHDTTVTLLDASRFDATGCEDELQSVSLPCYDVRRARQAFLDDKYVTSLPPDLLAFSSQGPPVSSSIQSSHSNLPEEVLHGLRPDQYKNPIYVRVTKNGSHENAISAGGAPSNRFMTLQYPKNRVLTVVTNGNNSPFTAAPVYYSPTSTTVLKQGYMTIPRKPRFPSWAPSTSGLLATEPNEFHSPISPKSGSETDSQLNPVYDNLGLRTTAGGNSTLNLTKAHPDTSIRYTMRDRPLPATPSTGALQPNPIIDHNLSVQSPPNVKIYEPINRFDDHLSTMRRDFEPLYGMAPAEGMNEVKSTKIPPRPPPKPKKKCLPGPNPGQLRPELKTEFFAEDCEEGTEV